jgi:hypothetical protein
MTRLGRGRFSLNFILEITTKICRPTSSTFKNGQNITLHIRRDYINVHKLPFTRGVKEMQCITFYKRSVIRNEGKTESLKTHLAILTDFDGIKMRFVCRVIWRTFRKLLVLVCNFLQSLQTNPETVK